METPCIEVDCAAAQAVREWCKYHYGVLYRAGTLPPKARKGISNNLTQIDLESGSGLCLKHGLVRIRVRKREGRSTAYACRTCERGDVRASPESRREANRRWRENNPLSYRESSLRRRRKQFGWDDEIGVAEYDDMLAKQKGKCAICLCEPRETVALAIDHDHDTGVVRGLLCTVCNWALGRFRDDPSRFDAAARYLRDSE